MVADALISYMIIELVNEQYFHILSVHLLNTMFIQLLFETSCSVVSLWRTWESYYLWEIFLQGKFAFVFIQFTVKFCNVKYTEILTSPWRQEKIWKATYKGMIHADITFFSSLQCMLEDKGSCILKILRGNYFEHKITCVKVK